jgi:hypothetical protein
LKSCFDTWVHNLYLGIDATPADGDAVLITATTVDDENEDEPNDEGLSTESHHDKDKPPTSTTSSPSSNTCSAYKIQTTVRVQIDGGYQNGFLIAQRQPITHDLWDKLLVQKHHP